MATAPKQRVLYLASRNAHKVAELQAVLRDTSFQVRSCRDLDPQLHWDETGSTFLANARIKAQVVKELTPCCVLADDSGLEVQALRGAPGVYSSCYAGKEGDDAANNMKLLRDLQTVPAEARQARFVCCLLFIDESNREHHFGGYCDGQITLTPQGANGFGYDPYFFVPRFAKTMAELTMEEKNAISHRGQALQQLLRHLGE